MKRFPDDISHHHTNGKYLIVHCSYVPLEIYARRKIEERIKEVTEFEYPFTPEKLMQILRKETLTEFCNVIYYSVYDNFK